MSWAGKYRQVPPTNQRGTGGMPDRRASVFGRKPDNFADYSGKGAEKV
jgi:hypothetical protein